MIPLGINEAYGSLLMELWEDGLHERNARTGVYTTILAGGHSIKLSLDALQVPGNRLYRPRAAAAEVAWQFMGTQDAAFMMRHAPRIWGKFVTWEQEGCVLKTAYGYRWRKHFGRDQLLGAMRELRENPTNRQLYVSAWDPATDGLGGPQPSNVPCPVGFSLTCVEDKLHCSVFLRSSDVVCGLPYDIMAYGLTADAIAVSCGLRPGTLHLTLAHVHYYQPHSDIMRESVTPGWKYWPDCALPTPRWSVEDILKSPDGYIRRVQDLVPIYGGAVDWDPKPEVVL